MNIEQAINKAIQIAKEQSDKEICGYIVKKSNNYDFYQCDNVAEDSSIEFEIDFNESELVNYIFDEVIYLVHSHPFNNQLHHLSHDDRASQYDNGDGMPWLLIKPNFTYEIFHAIGKFIGREYIQNKDDCYTIMKDFFNMCGLNLPEFDRSAQWWNEGKNYYLDNVPINGFYQTNKETLIPGDVLLFCYSSIVPNHCGVYIGDNKIIHHMAGRKSKIDTLDKFWIKFCHSSWRHEFIPSMFIDTVCKKIKGESNG